MPSLLVGESGADSLSKREQKSNEVALKVYRHAQVQPEQNNSDL